MDKLLAKIKFHNHQTPEQLKELEECRVAVEDLHIKNIHDALEMNLIYEKLSIDNCHQEHFAICQSIMGHINYHLGNYNLTLKNCELALRFTKNNQIKYRAYITSGAAYTYFGQFSNAIKVYYKALKTRNISHSSTIYNNIGAICFKQKEYEKAIEYFNKSLDLLNNDKSLIPGILNNIGRAYIEIKDLINAELFLSKAAKFLDEIENPTQEMINTLNIGLLLFKQEKYDEAYSKLLTAYHKCKELDLKNNLYSATLFLAHACFKKNLLKKANTCYLEALQLVRAKDKWQYNNTLKEYIDFIIALGNYKKAYVLLEEYDKNNDAILLNDQKNQLNLMSSKFSHAAKKMEIKKLKKESNYHKKDILHSLQIKKNNKELVVRNKHLVRMNNDLMESKILRSQLNPQFVYNTINSISKLVKEQQNHKADKYLLKFSEFTRELFNNNSKKEITLKNEIESCYRYIELEQLRLEKKISFRVKIDESISMNKQYIPSMIIQPIIENAIKYGNTDINEAKSTRINLVIHKNQQQLLFKISDNGMGFKQDIDEIIQSDKESNLNLINKRINIYNKKALDLKSLFLHQNHKNRTEISYSLNV